MKGNRIKQLREEKGLKQEELAKVLSVAPSTIGMYERDEREPNDSITLKIAEYFGVSTDYLLGKTNIKNIEDEFKTIYSKEIEGLTEEEIKEALEFYKIVKNNKNKEK